MMLKEKWVLTRTMHLGFCRETFESGNIIEVHETEIGVLFLKIGGRSFEATQDLMILKKQAAKNPHKPWIVPFNEEADSMQEEDIVVQSAPQTAKRPIAKHKADLRKPMQIVSSDQDLMEHEIDISHTKNTVIQAKKREDEVERKRLRKIEIEQGQTVLGEVETVEGSPSMKIVSGDDEYGLEGSAHSLNAGQVYTRTASELAEMRNSAADGSGTGRNK